MITITLYKNTEWMLRSNMRFSKSNTNKRKKRLMNNLKEF